MRGICKSFGTARVLDNVDLRLFQGEIVGLMGANGAGKSTLIKILAGVYTADRGEIELVGQRIESLAGQEEVGIVHQDLGLIDSLSVLDNVRLGATRMPLVGPILQRRGEIEAAEEALSMVGMSKISVFRLVSTLTPGEKALLAIGRLLVRGAKIIVVDETTASLNPDAAHWFLGTLRGAAAGGAAIIMVSHKLGEVRKFADRLVLLTDGRVAADVDMATFREHDEDLAKLLLGEEAEAVIHDEELHVQAEVGESLLEMEGAAKGSAGPITLTVRRGEAIGLSGNAGAGLSDLARMAAQMVRPESGVARSSRGTRIALLSAQREVDGVFAQLPSLWNMTVSALPKWKATGGLLNLRKERQEAEGMVETLQIKPPNLDVPINTLSGGNQQKVLFARVMMLNPDLLVLCDPTRGVDLRTRREIYKLIGQLKREHRAILVVTSDVEDTLAVCDQIGTVEDGQITQLWSSEQVDDSNLSEVL